MAEEEGLQICIKCSLTEAEFYLKRGKETKLMTTISNKSSLIHKAQPTSLHQTQIKKKEGIENKWNVACIDFAESQIHFLNCNWHF